MYFVVEQPPIEEIIANALVLLTREVRSYHDFEVGYSYLGVAPAGTAESAPFWTITRIGTGVEGVATGVAWDDRLTADYGS